MNTTARYHLLWLVGFLLLLGWPMSSWAQLTDTTNIGQRGAPRVYKYSARTGAMADATVADPNDLSVININPAGLAFVRGLGTAQINVSQNWENNLMLENFTLPAVRFSNHTLAFQFSTYHDRGFESLNLLGRHPLPSPKITMFQADIAYAVSIANVLSLGVLNNISYAENSAAQFWTYYPTLGLMYSPSESISYGIAFRGLGRSIVYDVANPAVTLLWSQDLREVLEIGARLKFPVDSEKTKVSISLSNEKRFREPGTWYKMGVEVKTLPYLALRSGMLFYPNNDLYAPRFGIGIVSDVVELDYTVSYVKDLYERYHQLGLTIHFDKF